MAVTAVAELNSILVDTSIWAAAEEDAIDGVRPEIIVQPRTIEEVSRVMALARRMGWRVAPRGGGTKLAWGNPPEALDLIIDLSRLDRVIDHAAGDLVVEVEAGVGLDVLQAQLIGAHQMLALDPVATGATVGGVIAANASGPRRFRYGTVRDLLIGVTIVLADGTIAKAGGKVVKNVAGYDLAKLVTGSLGTLGIIVKAIFRLHPRPPAQRLVEATAVDAEGIASAVQRLLHSTLVPSAIQLHWPADHEPRIAVLFEGVGPSVVAQAAAAADLLGAESAPAVRADDEVTARWSTLTEPPPPGRDVEIKVSCLPSELAQVIRIVRAAAGRRVGTAHLTGMLGNGILNLRLEDTDADGAVEVVREVRSRIQTGSVTVLAAPPEVKRQVDVWGPVGDAVGLMQRVKEQFDPDRILNPGRFVGGI